MGKNKRERFEEVAGKRVQAILDKLDLLGNCSSRNNYEYSETDVKKMIQAIKERIRNVEMLFNEQLSKKSKNKFQF